MFADQGACFLFALFADGDENNWALCPAKKTTRSRERCSESNPTFHIKNFLLYFVLVRPVRDITATNPTATTDPSSKTSSKSGEDISIYFRLILFFMEMRTVPGFVAGKD